MSDNYARACATPRRIELGGETLYVHKLTPRALAEIQAFFIESLENPFEAARAAIADMDEEAARTHWTTVYADVMGSWPPDVNSDTGMSLLASPQGRGVLVWAVARKYTRGLKRDDADAIGEGMSADEFFELFAALSPGEVGDLRNPASEGKAAMPYTELRCKLCERYPGWTFDDVDNLTFEQIGQACAGGKPVEIEVATVGDVQEAVRQWRGYYVGL